MVAVKSLASDGVKQCGINSVLSSAGGRHSAGIVGWRIYTGSAQRDHYCIHTYSRTLLLRGTL